jgi:hypothetical protein
MCKVIASAVFMCFWYVYEVRPVSVTDSCLNSFLIQMLFLMRLYDQLSQNIPICPTPS